MQEIKRCIQCGTDYNIKDRREHFHFISSWMYNGKTEPGRYATKCKKCTM